MLGVVGSLVTCILRWFLSWLLGNLRGILPSTTKQRTKLVVKLVKLVGLVGLIRIKEKHQHWLQTNPGRNAPGEERATLVQRGPPSWVTYKL